MADQQEPVLLTELPPLQWEKRRCQHCGKEFAFVEGIALHTCDTGPKTKRRKKTTRTRTEWPVFPPKEVNRHPPPSPYPVRKRTKRKYKSPAEQ